jgi:hypothetical protein
MLLILDKEWQIVAILVGQPDDPEWLYVINDAAKVFNSWVPSWTYFLRKAWTIGGGGPRYTCGGLPWRWTDGEHLFPSFMQGFILRSSHYRSQETLFIVGRCAA